MTHTRTVVDLDLSPAAYAEIADKLRAAGYEHAFMPGGAIDMHGLAVVPDTRPAICEGQVPCSDVPGQRCRICPKNASVPLAEPRAMAKEPQS